MIDRWLYRLALVLSAIAAVGLLLMMAQTVADVIADNFFNSPIPGNLEIISVYHMVLVVFLPLALVEWKHENIQVDLVFLMLSRRAQRVVLTFGYLVSASFFAILVRQTWIDAVNSYSRNEVMMGMVYVTIWPAKFMLPLGFAAIALITLRHAWRALTDPGFEPRVEDPMETETAVTARTP